MSDTPVTEDGDPDTTSSTETRWKYIGTVLSAVILLSLATIVVGTSLGVMAVSPIGKMWFTLYAIVVLMAATWAFGEKTLDAVQKARGK